MAQQTLTNYRKVLPYVRTYRGTNHAMTVMVVTRKTVKPTGNYIATYHTAMYIRTETVGIAPARPSQRILYTRSGARLARPLLACACI